MSEGFKVVDKLTEMKSLIESLEKEAARFDKGIKTSGTRVRKGMSQLKSLCQEVRDGIADVKSSMTPDPDKSARAKERKSTFGRQ